MPAPFAPADYRRPVLQPQFQPQSAPPQQSAFAWPQFANPPITQPGVVARYGARPTVPFHGGPAAAPPQPTRYWAYPTGAPVAYPR